MKNPEHSVIEKVLNNQAATDEIKEVVPWLGTAEGQNWLSSKMDADKMSIFPENNALHSDTFPPSSDMYGRIMHTIKRQRRKRLIARVAAFSTPFILFLLLITGLNKEFGLFAPDSPKEYEEVFARKGEHLQLVFQDGTRVYLNSDSHISFPRRFGRKERHIELEGEAWFDVAKDSKKPFVVQLDEMNLVVTGTAFNVKSYPGDRQVSVSLETGEVNIVQGKKAISLHPGDKAVYDRSDKRYRLMRPFDIRSSSKWKDHVFVFEHTPLQEVLTILSRRFNADFVIENESALRYSYTLTTNHEDMKSILSELEKITPVRFRQEGKVFKVKMKK